jgi:hypothetical protein
MPSAPARSISTLFREGSTAMTRALETADTTTPRPAKLMEILVATDFSDVASAALRVGVEHTRRLHGRLHVFHVRSPEEYEVTRRLADAADEAGADMPVTFASADGGPREAARLCRVADRSATCPVISVRS